MLVAGEESDLQTALAGHSGAHPHGLAVLEADFLGTTPGRLTWHPLTVGITGYQPTGVPLLQIRWGGGSVTHDPQLPELISELLTRWRSAIIDDKEAASGALAEAQHQGYEIHLTHSRYP